MNKRFYLLDTYAGIPEDKKSEAERSKRDDHAGHYSEPTSENLHKRGKYLLVVSLSYFEMRGIDPKKRSTYPTALQVVVLYWGVRSRS